MTYFLAPHVFACRTPDHVVILDIRADRYLALEETHAGQLSAWIAGWPGAASDDSSGLVNEQDGTEQLAQQMIEQGLLTTTHESGRATTAAPSLPAPTESFVHSYFVHQPGFKVRDVLRFARACADATLALKFRRLEQTIRSVATTPVQEPGPSANHYERTEKLVGIFEGLRPFLLAGTRSCMFDSLALMKFLSLYRLRPRWVFGVRTSPFAAHCWLQDGEYVLNDVPDHVGTFTPIMTV